jgi:tetratricopeptide (TPR) repeat protein
VTAQLIDASTDEHLWADNFDRELTDIFAIQTQVAEEIVAALEAELTPREAAMLEDRPTDSIEAYDLYLQARQNMQSIGLEAVQSYAEGVVFKLERAVAIDPGFSRAWALLAMAHGESYWFLADRSPERLQRMKDAVDRARAVDPMLPEALMAQALYHYRGFYEYEQALEALEQARELIPNDPLVHFNLGLTLRRLGRYDESSDAFLEAARLAPDGADAWGEALNTAVASGRVKRARTIVSAIPEAQQSVPRIFAETARFHLMGEGDVQRARALLDRYPESISWYDLEVRMRLAMAEGRFAEAARYAVSPYFQEAIARGSGRVTAALAMELGDRPIEAQALREEAATVLAKEVAKPYAETYAWPHLALAENLVRMGEPEAAVASCRRAMEILPIERDKVHGYELAESCAWVLAQAGLVDEALAILERSRPRYNLGPWYLSLMPEWAFLSDNPRFQALAAQGEAAGR